MNNAERITQLEEQLREERSRADKLEKDFKLYRGLFTRIKDQIVGGHGPEEMFRFQDALKENDKGEGRVDAVGTLITYFYMLCAAKSRAEAERDKLREENKELRGKEKADAHP